MGDQLEVVDGEAMPAPELEEAVEEQLASAAIVVRDPRDEHEGMVAMDANDAARFVERLVRQAQEQNLGKRWVYELPAGGSNKTRGLTGDAVEDITQQMNWTGKCRIGVVPETLAVEQIEADEGDGPEPFWVATIAARDELTGAHHVGTSMEPQRMKLRPDTANKKRKEGKQIGEDNRIFDRFSRAKAVNKASRNALEKFIPEAVKVTLIAMSAKDPALVERIESTEEARLREMPAPLDTPEAKALRAECARIYDEIRELGGGRGKVLFPPGRYNAWLVHAQHDLDALRNFKLVLEQRREEIKAEVEA